MGVYSMNKKKKVTVLIADDQTLFREGIKDVLTGEKWMEVVGEAADGLEAVAKAKQLKPDVVLMDIKMPVMNGLEATKAIRQFDKNIPIVAVTANVLDFDRKTALANGCNEFVTKPVVRSQLIAVVETYKRK